MYTEQWALVCHPAYIWTKWLVTMSSYFHGNFRDTLDIYILVPELAVYGTLEDSISCGNRAGNQWRCEFSLVTMYFQKIAFCRIHPHAHALTFFLLAHVILHSLGDRESHVDAPFKAKHSQVTYSQHLDLCFDHLPLTKEAFLTKTKHCNI